MNKELKNGKIELEDILLLVQSNSKVNIIKRSRKPDYVHARYVFYRLALDEGYTLTEIGRACGGRDHATVLHGKKTFADLFNQVVFRHFKNLYHNCRIEIDAAKDNNSNLIDFLLRFKEEIKEMSGKEYSVFKVRFLKELGYCVESRNQKNINISSEIASNGSYIFASGEDY